MTDIEIVVFNDKSWIRFAEYQKLQKENELLIIENEEMKKGLGCETCQIHLEFASLNNEIRKLGEDIDVLTKKNEETIKWNKQSEKDIYKVASSTWDFNRYLCILKNGAFALATSICDEGADGSISCWFEFCDEELDEKYYVDDIEYWVLLEEPKGETK